MRILVLNAGSSSLKASAIDGPDVTVARAEASWGFDASRAADRATGLQAVMQTLAEAGASLESFDAVGHRVVHGGSRFSAAAVVDDEVLAGIRAARDLAPLHNDVALETIAAARKLLPAVPHVAAFDTAFHATLPPAGYRYPVPAAWFHTGGSAVTASTACRCRGRSARRRNCWISRPRRSGWSWRTSAAAARSRPWTAGGRWIRRWE